MTFWKNVTVDTEQLTLLIYGGSMRHCMIDESSKVEAIDRLGNIAMTCM